MRTEIQTSCNMHSVVCRKDGFVGRMGVFTQLDCSVCSRPDNCMS